MLARIGQMIAAAMSALAAGVAWTGQLARSVFRLPFELIGGGQPMPAPYEPEVERTDILDELVEARKRQAAVSTLDRDGVDTVLRYVNAMPEARPTFDLSGVAKAVQITLATIDDNEIDALKYGGLSAIRKFVGGKESVHGVPVVKEAPSTGATDPLPSSSRTIDNDLWKATAQFRRRNESRDFVNPRP